LADGEKALQERMEALEMAKRAETEGPKMIKEAQEELARVKEKTRKVFQQIGMGKLIDDGAIDDKLVKYVVLMEGTPRGLAEFASQSPENEAPHHPTALRYRPHAPDAGGRRGPADKNGPQPGSRPIRAGHENLYRHPKEECQSQGR
jgi:hypothetical protein